MRTESGRGVPLQPLVSLPGFTQHSYLVIYAQILPPLQCGRHVPMQPHEIVKLPQIELMAPLQPGTLEHCDDLEFSSLIGYLLAGQLAHLNHFRPSICCVHRQIVLGVICRLRKEMSTFDERWTSRGRSMRVASPPMYCPKRARHDQKPDASFSSESPDCYANPDATRIMPRANSACH